MSSRALVALGLALTSAGCFDVEQAQVPAVVMVDNFEDGDRTASPESGFGNWDCFLNAEPSGQAPEPSCQLTGGFASRFADSMTFSLAAVPSVDLWGAVLATSAVGTVTLRPFRVLGFQAMLSSADPVSAEAARLSIQFSCPGAVPGASVVTVRYFSPEGIEGVPLTPEWSSYRLLFADFAEPWWEGALVDDPAVCLENVRAMEFMVEPRLGNGLAPAGTLVIDDVYFK
jgi:hypothetical protein